MAKSIKNNPNQRSSDENAGESRDGQPPNAPAISPELVEIFTKLRGDNTMVRDTILAGFRQNEMEGLGRLKVATIAVKDVELAKRLVAIIGEFGEFTVGQMAVPPILFELAQYAPSAEVRGAVSNALIALSWKIFSTDFLFVGREWTASEKRRFYDRIQSATACTQEPVEAAVKSDSPARHRGNEPSATQDGDESSATGRRKKRQPTTSRRAAK